MGMRYSISVVDNFLIAKRDSYKASRLPPFKDTSHSTLVDNVGEVVGSCLTLT